MRVEIIFHSEELSRLLRDFRDRIATGQGRHLRDGLIAAARRYMVFVRARFLRASRHDGTWKDHASSTKLAKLRKYTPGIQPRITASVVGGQRTRAIDTTAGLTFPILFDTGQLYQSLSPGGPGYIERFVDPLTIRVGTSVPYAQYHQTGTARMPQRVIQSEPDAPTSRDIDAILTKAVEAEAAELSATL